ncbi:hypothetical protein JCM21531_3149 [Acetivibrio straminisolvens JCM 21531]|uniref:Uncharacterized protein n=1 Tax=Acetivibrio straminisolvens JCM 21531 TaxID=1294263 RepID=W4V9V7_9FIRM|nr:hypothetical protein JCM21531_3149 [Acetivibrio straminisolvens JCM 21531]
MKKLKRILAVLTILAILAGINMCTFVSLAQSDAMQVIIGNARQDRVKGLKYR